MHEMADEFVGSEPQRGCGSRKKGGMYITSKRVFGYHCEKLPFPLGRCKYCHEGLFKDALRVPKIVDSLILVPFAEKKKCEQPECSKCPVNCLHELGEIMLWGVGAESYPLPEDFIQEANEMGISKRIHMVPEYIEKEVGIESMANMMCFLVHPLACLVNKDEDEYGAGKVDIEETVSQIFGEEEATEQVRVPGVFMVFRPEQVEYVTDNQELEEKEDKILKLKERGIKIIEFPEDYWDDDEASGEEE